MQNYTGQFLTLKKNLAAAKNTYECAVDERAKCQRELNSLLQKKHAWNEHDVNRFTELYKAEIRLETAEKDARERNCELDRHMDASYVALMDAIRERYQHEQLWSDKIRKVSAYGTVGLLLVNLVLFGVVHAIIEPRKRRLMIAELRKLVSEAAAVSRDNQRPLIADKPPKAATQSSP